MHDDSDQDIDSGRRQTFPIGVLPLQLARSISLQQMFDLPRITDNGSSTRFPASSNTGSNTSTPAQMVTNPSSIVSTDSPSETRRPPSPTKVTPEAALESSQEKPEKRTRAASTPGFEIIPGSTNDLTSHETPIPERPTFDTSYTFLPVAPMSADLPPANAIPQSPPYQFPRTQTPPRNQDFPNSNNSPPDSPSTEPSYVRTPRLRRRRSSIFPPPVEDLARSRATSLAPRGRTPAPRTPKPSAPPTKVYATRSRSAGPQAGRQTGEVLRDPVVERYQREEAVREFGLRKRRREGEDGEGYFLRKGARTVTSRSEVRD